MNKWLAGGLLGAGVLSFGSTAFYSAKAAAAQSASAGLSGANSAKGETPLGDAVADALKLAAKSEIALVPAGLIEERDLPANAKSPDAAKQVLSSPSEEVMVVQVSGKQLLGALERSVSLAPRKNQGFLQVAGLAITFDPNRPEGNRILDAKVNGTPLQQGKTYSVAMPVSLAHGALGYFRFWDKKDAKSVTANGDKVTLLDALTDYLKAGKASPKAEKRISSK